MREFKRWQPVRILNNVDAKFVNYIEDCGDINGVDGCRVSVQSKGRKFWAVIPEHWVSVKEAEVEECTCWTHTVIYESRPSDWGKINCPEHT